MPQPQPYLTQLIDLCLIELTNWRWSWRSLVTISMILPLMSMISLAVFARDAGAEALAYVYSGNVVLAVMFSIQNKVQGHFVFMRMEGVLNYFATLPVHRSAVILAVIIAFFLLSLPSMLVTIFVGALLLGVPLMVSPWLIVVLVVCSLPMAAIGAWIGVTARGIAEGSTLNLLVTMMMLALGPVVVPPDRLPKWMAVVGRLSPATYAADAFRQVLLGRVTPQLAIDLAVLTLFTVLLLAIIVRKIDWRR